MNYKFIEMDTGKIVDKNIQAGLWGGLHYAKPTGITREQNFFLKSHGLSPTIFNLNCLEHLQGVVLTEAQAQKVINMGKVFNIDEIPEIIYANKRLELNKRMQITLEKQEKLLYEYKESVIHEKLKEIQNEKIKN